ncbi:MAG: Asp-tRNA(Asn)/Glu-tRNA(Gln) amidotransferase GatCAB subunit B, partial [Chloroflexi bacterium]|nr:Asp-tRNA(Asn)/Glu-tRNA(Gln) amidotransferase GatCAB subunit B [Chloroflexota bacterium]
RVLADGTAFEIERQTAVLNSGGQVVQETRGWHDAKRLTFSQRIKEEAEDYRYFAEPDLPPLYIDDAWIERVRADLPELPEAKIARYQSDYGLSDYDSRVLAEEREVALWFETAVTAGGTPKLLANWISNDLFKLMNESKQAITDIKVTPTMLAELVGLVEKGTVNSSTAVSVLADMFASGETAQSIVAAKGLAQISDEDALVAIVEQVLDENPDSVAAYLGGKEKLRGWFVGQVMKATRGKANPGLVNKLLVQALGKRKE